MNLTTTLYDTTDKKQVMALICNEYHYNIDEYKGFFQKFYENDFQRNAIKIVVKDTDANQVVGFFALFYWPYYYNGKTYNSYKGVNAIVSPNYRGNGIFKKILNFVDTHIQQLDIDFLIATPLPAAYYGFKRNNWTALLDLNWFVKINNYLSLFFKYNHETVKAIFPETKKVNLNRINNLIYQNDDLNFIEWRTYFYKIKKFYISYNEGDKTVQFGLKLNIRKKIIKELIVGEISTNHHNAIFLAKGINFLLKEIKKIKAVTIVSIAINPNDSIIVEAIRNNNFSEIKNKIHVVVKNLKNNEELLNKEKWILYRADLDSW